MALRMGKLTGKRVVPKSEISELSAAQRAKLPKPGKHTVREIGNEAHVIYNKGGKIIHARYAMAKSNPSPKAVSKEYVVQSTHAGVVPVSNLTEGKKLAKKFAKATGRAQTVRLDEVKAPKMIVRAGKRVLGGGGRSYKTWLVRP